MDLTVIGLCWGMSLILPHFQTLPSALELVVDLTIIGVLSISIFRLLSSPVAHNKRLRIAAGLTTFGGFGLGILLLKIWGSSFYEIWSHLGAGTMKIEGEVFIFGDLAHLTSAASCREPIIISTNVCDPWGRAFNQNPDVGEVFRILQLANSNLVGIVSTFIFLVLFVITNRTLRVENLSPYLMTLTPVFILALDRGNELITVSLILIGIVCFHGNQNRVQILGSAAFSSAVFFKIWPIFLVFFILIFHWKIIKIPSRVILFFPFIYLAIKFEELQDIVLVTQSGSPFGTSFGLSLLASSQISMLQALVFALTTLVVTSVLIGLGNRDFEDFITSNLGKRIMPWVLSLMLTYCAIWASGESFIYRMIILVPLVLILSSREVVTFHWCRIVISAILVTSISSRLPIIIALTSGLALYFCFVAIKVWRVRTSELHK
jgi:hypothetical protein